MKSYEISNHLGNVLTTITDRKIPVNDNGTISGYTADITSTIQYFPFGLIASIQPPNSEYRFGFQGQEKDDEITGTSGSHLNYKFRMYDSRIGRFFAVDPLASKYPYWTPYAFSGNRVIDAVELEGLEPVVLYDPNSKLEEDQYLYDEAELCEISDEIHIFGHFQMGKGIKNSSGVGPDYIADAEDFAKLLDEYNIPLKGKTKIVFHVCLAEDVAKKISKDDRYKNIIIQTTGENGLYSVDITNNDKYLSNTRPFDRVRSNQEGRIIVGKGFAKWHFYLGGNELPSTETDNMVTTRKPRKPSGARAENSKGSFKREKAKTSGTKKQNDSTLTF